MQTALLRLDPRTTRFIFEQVGHPGTRPSGSASGRRRATSPAWPSASTTTSSSTLRERHLGRGGRPLVARRWQGVADRVPCPTSPAWSGPATGASPRRWGELAAGVRSAVLEMRDTWAERGGRSRHAARLGYDGPDERRHLPTSGEPVARLFFFVTASATGDPVGVGRRRRGGARAWCRARAGFGRPSTCRGFGASAKPPAATASTIHAAWRRGRGDLWAAGASSAPCLAGRTTRACPVGRGSLARRCRRALAVEPHRCGVHERAGSTRPPPSDGRPAARCSIPTQGAEFAAGMTEETVPRRYRGHLGRRVPVRRRRRAGHLGLDGRARGWAPDARAAPLHRRPSPARRPVGPPLESRADLRWLLRRGATSSQCRAHMIARVERSASRGRRPLASTGHWSPWWPRPGRGGDPLVLQQHRLHG